MKHWLNKDQFLHEQTNRNHCSQCNINDETPIEIYDEPSYCLEIDFSTDKPASTQRGRQVFLIQNNFDHFVGFDGGKESLIQSTTFPFNPDHLHMTELINWHFQPHEHCVVSACNVHCCVYMYVRVPNLMCISTPASVVRKRLTLECDRSQVWKSVIQCTTRSR